VPVDDWDQFQVVGMLLIADNCLLRPLLSCMSVKLLTPEPPVHFQVVFQAMVVPLMLVSWAQSDPDDAPERPH